MCFFDGNLFSLRVRHRLKTYWDVRVCIEYSSLVVRFLLLQMCSFFGVKEVDPPRRPRARDMAVRGRDSLAPRVGRRGTGEDHDPN